MCASKGNVLYVGLFVPSAVSDFFDVYKYI